MNYWGPLAALLWFLVASGAPKSPQSLENPRPLSENPIQHQTEDSEGEATLYFPDYVDGGGWSVQLVLSNVDPDATADVRIEVYDPDGRSILDLFDSDLMLEIPPLASRVLKSAGSGAIRRGWIQVETGAPTISGLLTYRNLQSGVEVGVKPVELGEQFALFVEESPTVGSGVAVFKPDAPGRLELRIRGEEGNDPLEGGFVPWGDFHHAARTLPEWFTAPGVDTGFLKDLRGLLFLEAEDESEFAPLGLRFGKGTSSLSVVPAIRNPGREPQETPLYFPDYVDGDGWSVQLVLSNIDPDAAAEAVVEVYDQNGGSIRDLFDSEPTLEIPPLGNRILKSSGMGPIRRGWVQVRAPSESVSGLLTYRQAQTGIEVSVESVALGSQFGLFVEESEAIGAGLALFKPDASPSVELRLRDEAGNDPLGNVYVPWGNFHQRARTLQEWFDVAGVDAEFLTDFRGLLFLRTADGSLFAPLGLRFGKTSRSLSAVPAIRISEGRGIDGGQAPPPAVTISASPSSINRGQSTTLTWSSTSAESAEITQGIGAVPTSGSRQVTPNVTTTYRITVRGADGETGTASVTVTVVSERVVLRALFEALDGPNWTHGDNWLTDAPLEEWYGVEVDSLGRVVGLRLTRNGLTGEIPPEFASLPYLRVLDLSGNQLSGPLPPEWGQLSQVQQLYLVNNQLTGPLPPEWGQLSQLQYLNLSGNQLSGPLPPEWGQLSQVQHLDLVENQLSGPLPPGWGQLFQLQGLSLAGNELSGPLPPEWGQLSQVQQLYLVNNQLTGPLPPEWGQLSQVQWLGLALNQLSGPLPPRWGQLSQVQHLDLTNNQLTGPLPPEWGQLFQLQGLSLGGNELSGPLPPEWGQLSQLQGLSLGGNELSGPLPPEWGQLSQLQRLYLWGNQLGGPLPPEWGPLSQLQDLYLGGNELSGPLPPGWGQLSQLQRLYLGENQLNGPLPPEWGQLSQLQRLDLDGNELSGPLPPEWGQLSQLQELDLSWKQLSGPLPPEWGQMSQLQGLNLSGNQLSGPLPSEWGQLSHLESLGLTNNFGLSGTLPSSLTSLRQLEELLARGTELCAPSTTDFQSWLAGIRTRRIAPCVLPMAYLTQAVQSREYPVPLVAGENALLRVFVTSTRAGVATIPRVRARFYVNGREIHVVDIPPKSAAIPNEVNEGNLNASANATIPGRVVQPGLEMVVDIDPDGALGSDLGVTKRIPESGRLAVEVHEMPVFDLTVIPFLWTEKPDSTIVEVAKRMAADPESNSLLWHTRTLLPIGDLEVSAHEPVMSSSKNKFALLDETGAIRAMEGASGYYMGMMSVSSLNDGGVAAQPGKISFAGPWSEVIGHELGHNLNLGHAPCGNPDPDTLDPSFPETNGSIGAWGYDFRGAGRLVPPTRPELMSYCHPNKWISDYHFTNALRYRLSSAAEGSLSSLVAAPARSLLLWGGVDAAGTPFLEPAFVVEAPASLPRSTGEYRISGRRAGGDELFSLPFAMPEVADGDGRSSFAFVLPAKPEWTDTLTSITLSGPRGSVTLDQETNRPVTILRNPRTGQIRAILRGAAATPPNVDATVSALSLDQGLERLTSRGIPDPEDWKR